jgi:hypothetical protein
VTWVKWKLVSVRLETMLILVQDRCTICADVPYACKSLAYLIELLSDMGHVEDYFDLYGDNVNLSARWFAPNVP